MTTPLEDAIAAFRDLAQSRQRLEQEIAEAETRLHLLNEEHGIVCSQYQRARGALHVLAAGMPCKECAAPAHYAQADANHNMLYRCERCARAAQWVV